MPSGFMAVVKLDTETGLSMPSLDELNAKLREVIEIMLEDGEVRK